MKKQFYRIVDIDPSDEKLYPYRYTLIGEIGYIDEEDIEEGFIDGYSICTFHFRKPLKQIGSIRNVELVLFMAVKIEKIETK